MSLKLSAPDQVPKSFAHKAQFVFLIFCAKVSTCAMAAAVGLLAGASAALAAVFSLAAWSTAIALEAACCGAISKICAEFLNNFLINKMVNKGLITIQTLQLKI